VNVGMGMENTENENLKKKMMLPKLTIFPEALP
jgi:hypothetical protein